MTADQIRTFMKRAENLLNTNEVPNEDFELTPAETFELLVENSLKIPIAQ